VDDLFKTFRQMASDGHALIFISHKLHEVLAISQRVTVLRDGRVIGSRPTTGATKVELAQMMVGRPVILQYKRHKQQPGEVMLDVRNIFAKSDRGGDSLKGVSLTVQAGEILGLAGVSGNGQRELAECLAGLRPIRQGKVLLNGHDVTHASPNQHIITGQSYIPEERMKEGVIKEFSVADNFVLEDHARPPFAHGIFLNFKAIQDSAKATVDAYNVKTPNLQTPIKNLSGGNIQKLILGRELSRHPKVLIAAQPTRGVDIGATEYIHLRLLEQRQAGTATLLISEDLDEIRALSDRIAVIFEGQIVGMVANEDVTLEQLGLMMSGVHETEV
jgi:ABC-type uncharacterized transport system ATPase subunit